MTLSCYCCPHDQGKDFRDESTLQDTESTGKCDGLYRMSHYTVHRGKYSNVEVV